MEYACFKIGVIHAPLDLRLKSPEVVRSLKLIEAKGFAFLGKTSTADFGSVALAVQEQCPFVEHYIQFATGDFIEGAIPFDAFAQQARELAVPSADPTTSIWKAYVTAHDSVKPNSSSRRKATRFTQHRSSSALPN